MGFVWLGIVAVIVLAVWLHSSVEKDYERRGIPQCGICGRRQPHYHKDTSRP